jgi:hypothetical protein
VVGKSLLEKAEIKLKSESGLWAEEADALYQGTTSTARRDRLVVPAPAKIMRALDPAVAKPRPECQFTGNVHQDI